MESPKGLAIEGSLIIKKKIRIKVKIIERYNFKVRNSSSKKKLLNQTGKRNMLEYKDVERVCNVMLYTSIHHILIVW